MLVQVVDQTTLPLSWHSFVSTGIQDRSVSPALQHMTHSLRSNLLVTDLYTPMYGHGTLGLRQYVRKSC